MVRHYTTFKFGKEGTTASGGASPSAPLTPHDKRYLALVDPTPSVFCFFELPGPYCSCFSFFFAAFAAGSCTGGRFTQSPIGPVLISRTAFFQLFFSGMCLVKMSATCSSVLVTFMLNSRFVYAS